MSEYKFTPIIIEKDKDGKLVLDEEKLKELLKEAYSNGYADGQLASIKESPATTQPYNPIPYYPDVVPTIPTVPISPYWPPTSPYWYERFYCVSNS